MTRLSRRIALLVFCVSLVAVAQEPSVSSTPNLPAVTRGDTVTVQGNNFPAQGVKVFLRTGAEREGDKGLQLDATVTADSKAVTFKVPKEHFDTGRYLVFVAIGSKELAVPGELRVLSDQAAKVRVDSISPSTDYQNDADNAYDFEISGEDLGAAPGDNILEIVGSGPQPVGSAEECQRYAATHNYEKICLSYDPGMETRKLKVKGFHPAHYQGPVDFRVRVGNNVSDVKRVNFSSITEGNLRLLATAVSVILAIIVLATVWKGVSMCRVGEPYSFLDSFFLDKESMSYSLSKFQLIAWTAVAVFAYVYVFFCRTLIQWDFSFPTIPSGWPTLLGLSAGTTVAAVGITSTRGSKGAGAIKPSFADFISAGGLVTSERFQFFVWTLLGCFSFLMLILAADPSSLKDLPDVPQGFLFLTGISAAGYLGGKAVRSPGPVIAQLLVESAESPGNDATGNPLPVPMIIILKGQNLSTNAQIKIDGDNLRDGQYKVEALDSQDQAADSTFKAAVKLTLNDAAKYLEGQHALTYINSKDGQMATEQFPLDPLTITSVSALTEGDVTITVNGANFEETPAAEWRNPPDGSPKTPVNVVKKSDKELTITVPPATLGEGKLTLISAIGLRTSTTVHIGKKAG
jgi:hypothetical protein